MTRVGNDHSLGGWDRRVGEVGIADRDHAVFATPDDEGLLAQAGEVDARTSH